MKTKIKYLGIALFCIIVAVGAFFWVKKVKKVNEDVTESKVYENESVVKHRGNSYEVTGVKVWDFKQFVYEHKDFGWALSESGDIIDVKENGRKIRVLTVDLRCTIGSPGEVLDSKFVVPNNIRNTIGNVKIVSEEFLKVALNDFKIGQEFNYDQTYEFCIPFMLRDFCFDDNSWQKLVEQNPDMLLVLAYRPEEVFIALDNSEYIPETPEAVTYFETVYEDTVFLNDPEFSYLIPMENNIFDNNAGDYKDEISFKINSIKQIKNEDILMFEDDISYYEQFYGDDTHKKVLLELTISNKLDEKQCIYMNNTRFTTWLDDTKYLDGEMLFMDTRSFEDDKSAGVLVLEPGEERTINIAYDILLDASGEEGYNSTLEATDWYFVYNPAGSATTTMNDKTKLFIKINKE